MLRNKLSELSIIVIDKISMVSNKLLLHIYQRLIEIFGCSEEIPFAGISVIACGDFYQLPPIQAKPVYADYKHPMLNISHCWKYFRIAELTEVMNGQIGIVKHLKTDVLGKIAKLYLEMYDDSSGRKAIKTDPYAMQHKLVPNERVEKKLNLTSIVYLHLL